MEMLSVYPNSIIYFFAPLGGLADEGINLDVRLRPSVVLEETIKPIYERELKPAFFALDPRLQTACKLSLRYFLHASEFNYRNEFNSMLLPFDCPEPPRLGFLWLWEVLYPNEQPLPLEQPFEIDRRGEVARYIIHGY